MRSGIIVRSYLDGSSEHVIYDTEYELKAAIENLKSRLDSNLVNFEIFTHKETFSKQQVWSNSNG